MGLLRILPVSKTVAFTIVLFLGGCASGTNVSDYNKRVSYEIGGHFYAVNYIAYTSQAVGMSQERAQRLACFAQAPDDIDAYNAIPVSIKNFFYDRGYRHDVMNSLHSLHGGDSSEVKARRDNLHDMVARSFAEGPSSDWKTGFLIHALGDSYAHVHGTYSSPIAYGEGVGHLFAKARGEAPDNVYNGENYLNFRDYLISLHSALVPDGEERVDDSLQSLLDLSDAIKRYKDNPNLKDQLLINTLKKYPGGDISWESCKAVDAELDDGAVRAFLRSLSLALK